MTPEQTQQIVNLVLTTVLVPVLPAIALFIITWFKTKTALLRQDIKNQELYKYLDIFDKTVYDVVNGLQQEFVKDLKAKSQDGTLTIEEKAEMRDKAVKGIISILGESGIEILEDVYGDINKAINAKIHAEVGEIRKEAEYANK